MLANIVTPGNVHDSYMLEPLVKKVIDQEGRQSCDAADAAYKRPAIANFLLENNVLPALQYKRPMTKEGLFKNTSMSMTSISTAISAPKGRFLTTEQLRRKVIANMP